MGADYLMPTTSTRRRPSVRRSYGWSMPR